MPPAIETDDAWIDLYWLPLGAGGRCVRWNGRVYERLAAIRQRRRPDDLCHSALLIHFRRTTYAVEMGPVWNVAATDRGVVCEGPVGARILGRFRAFRYEVRCWPGGSIPDLAEAVGGAHRVTDDPAQVAAVLSVLPQVPPLTWGRDELRSGVARIPSHAANTRPANRPAGPRRGPLGRPSRAGAQLWA